MKDYKHISLENIKEILNEIKFEDYESLVDEICIQIREYYTKLPEINGKKAKLIIGLSGGIDSTVVSYLAVRAIGSENIITVNMPSYENDPQIEQAKNVSEILRTKNYIINIKSIVTSEIKSINQIKEFEFNPKEKIRLGNLASRTRVTILYDIAKKINGKVLGTGNRTEFVQGYAAKWGTPISYDFGILDQLYKVDIYEIAKILEVPREIIEAKPSTGYYLGQTHEKELGATLEEQDVLAYLLFERKFSKEDILRRYRISSHFVDTMINRFIYSEEKRMIKQKHVTIRELK